MKRTLMSSGLALAVLCLPAVAGATVEMQKQAKAAGATVANCSACHVAKMPKKDAFDLNDKGKWLVDQKKARKAEKVDGAWLKEYK
jgi:mono/diheme cytochrome c family protein